MPFRQQLGIQTVILLAMAIISLTIILPVLFVSWQSLRGALESGCLDRRSGEVFNYVLVGADDTHVVVDAEQSSMGDGCFVYPLVGAGVTELPARTPGAAEDNLLIDGWNTEADLTASSLYSTIEEYGRATGVGRISATDFEAGDIYFAWAAVPELPTVVPRMVVIVSGLAILISIGSLLLMCLPVSSGGLYYAGGGATGGGGNATGNRPPPSKPSMPRPPSLRRR